MAATLCPSCWATLPPAARLGPGCDPAGGRRRPAAAVLPPCPPTAGRLGPSQSPPSCSPSKRRSPCPGLETRKTTKTTKTTTTTTTTSTTTTARTRATSRWTSKSPSHPRDSLTSWARKPATARREGGRASCRPLDRRSASSLIPALPPSDLPSCGAHTRVIPSSAPCLAAYTAFCNLLDPESHMYIATDHCLLVYRLPEL